jgi:medium-chain acyl-[acyl-carrier-protein] hydrolase
MDVVPIRIRKVLNPERRVYAFPPAGGSQSLFRRFALQLPRNVEAIVLQRVQSREPLQGGPGFGGLVQKCVQICSGAASLPYAFVGHSMGALLAFETALHMSNAPLVLMLSGCSSPQSFGGKTSFFRSLAGAGAPELWKFLVDNSPLLNGSEISTELREFMITSLRSDFGALSEYEYTLRPPLPSPLIVAVGRDDSLVNVETLDEWSCLSALSTTRLELRGGHSFLDYDQPLASQLSRQLQ